jgi:hypothetical protein
MKTLFHERLTEPIYQSDIAKYAVPNNTTNNKSSFSFLIMQLFNFLTIALIGGSVASARYTGVGRRDLSKRSVCFEPFDCLLVRYFSTRLASIILTRVDLVSKHWRIMFTRRE